MIRDRDDNEFPIDVILRYIDNPNFCPFCNSSQITSFSPVTTNEDEGEIEVVQGMMCVDCTNMWLDMYQLRYIVPFVDDTEDEEEPF